MYQPPERLDNVEIFTSTFNMGSCDINILEDVPKWIPLGYDLYAIAVQVSSLNFFEWIWV